MKTINLKEILKDRGLKTREVAEQLFPTNASPSNALHRIINGESELRASQISKLSTLTGVPIQDLFQPSGWSAKAVKDSVIFKNGRYTATFDTSTGITYLCDSRSMLHEAVMTKKSITLDAYLAELDTIIKNASNESRN